MNRLNIVLLLMVVGSAIWLIRSSNEARTLFVALEQAKSTEQALQVDHERLKIERRTAATPLVVEDMVRQKLRMSTASPGVTHYLNEGQAMSAAGSARAPAASEVQP